MLLITPERFTRMALTAVSNTPELEKCTPMSFIAALMNAAQLGPEPNTPLDSKLRHIPAMTERGEMLYVYALFKLQNGGLWV